MHVRKGDTVIVTAGKEKGKKGKILRLLNKNGRVVVERLAMTKRHTKPTQNNDKGGIVEREGSIEMSNVMLWCSKCSAGRRSKSQSAEAEKQRLCIKCGTMFEAA